MTDLTDAEQRTLAWQTLPCRTTTCLQPAGRRCITSSGERTSPHAPRIYDIRAYLLGQATAQAENAALTAQVASLKASYEQVTAALSVSDDKLEALAVQVKGLTTSLNESAEKLVTAERALADYKASHPDAPTPEPSKRLVFGIGMNEKPTSFASPLPFTPTTLEQLAGVKFSYAREYFSFPASGLAQSAVTWCEAQMKAGRVPVASFKLPGSWADAAAGKIDAVVNATINGIELMSEKYDVRAIVAVHHEPDNGDGKLADFLAMTKRLLSIVQRPGAVEYWTCETGFYDTGAEWQMGSSFVAGIDGIGFDPYLTLGQVGKNNTTKLTNQRTQYYEKFAAVAKKLGCQWGIWETGESEFAASSKVAGTATFIPDCADDAAELDATMWIYWNNKKAADMTDWRISTTAPGNKRDQMVAAMKAHAPA